MTYGMTEYAGLIFERRYTVEEQSFPVSPKENRPKTPPSMFSAGI